MNATPRTMAGLVGGCALLAALATLGLALADPSPSRHVRGLLVTIDLVLLAGAATAWLRVVLAVGEGRVEENHLGDGRVGAGHLGEGSG